MANTIAYASLFQQTLDEQMQEILTSRWMEANASQVIYNGGNTVKIPKLTTTGLGDYSRSTFFPAGAITLEYETRTFSMDRGTEFALDSMDVDESNFVLTASRVMGDFQKNHVAPEVDAYRYEQIFKQANQKLKTEAYTPAVGTVYTQLKNNIAAVQNIIGESEQLVIAMSYTAANLLSQSTEIEHAISLTDFNMGEINTKVEAIDGIPIFRVPGARFKTAYTYSATNGFAASAEAMAINWEIVPMSRVIAIVKTDKPRIFSPEVNQSGDAWLMQYRKYHDIWMMDNTFDGVWVSYTAIAAIALTATIAAGTGTGNTKATVTVGSGNTLAYSITDTAQTALQNAIPTGLTAYTSGADIAITADKYLNLYELDATGHIVKFVSVQVTSGEISA